MQISVRLPTSSTTTTLQTAVYVLQEMKRELNHSCCDPINMRLTKMLHGLVGILVETVSPCQFLFLLVFLLCMRKGYTEGYRCKYETSVMIEPVDNCACLHSCPLFLSTLHCGGRDYVKF